MRRKRSPHAPAKPIRLYSTRQRLADSAEFLAFAAAYLAAIAIIALDLFVWRPN